MDGMGHEIRQAARRLVRSPVFTLTAVLTLALAIGANASIFAVVQRVVLNPLPYPDSDRLIELQHGMQRLNVPSGIGMTLGLYYQYSDRVTHAQWCRALPDGRRDAHRRRRAGTDPDRARDDDAGVGAARVAGARSLVHGGGRRAGRRAGGRVIAWALEAPVRRRRGHPRPADGPGRRADGGDRRHAGLVCVPRSTR